MTSTRLIVFVLTLVALAGVLFQGNRVLLRQRARLTDVQQRTEGLNRQLAARVQVRNATLRELTLAEAQLAQLSPARTGATTGDSGSGDLEFASWIARVKRLQQLVEQHPDQLIPEMRVLTDDDWLSVARNRQLDSEEDVRRALAAVRTAAKDRFIASLTEAIRRFNTAATPDQTVALPRPGRGGAPGDGGFTTARTPPATAMDLAPYLQNPADAEVLTRLAILPNGPRWTLQEKVAIDADYDGGYKVSSDGSGSVGRPPWAWFPSDFNERSMRASRAYMAAHNGLHSAGYAEIFPYFDPPLEPAIAEKILKAERDRSK